MVRSMGGRQEDALGVFDSGDLGNYVSGVLQSGEREG